MKISWKKRIIGILLAILMLFDTFSVDYVYAQTEGTEISVKESTTLGEQVYVGDFNLNQYRADLYLKNDTVSNRIIQFMMEMQFPSRVVTDQLNGNKVFQNSVSAWKTVHFATSPSEIAKGGIDEKGYYTAIILSVFKAQTNNDTYLWDNVKKVTSNTNKILSNVKEWVKESDQISLDFISKNQILMTIPVNEQKLIREHLAGEFQKNHPVLNTSNTIISDLTAIFDAVETLGEAIELMESYICIMEISDSMKSVLTQMYQQCSDNNPAMKSALYETSRASENLSGALSATISNTAEKETINVLGILLDTGWNTLIQSNPYAQAFMIGANVGTWLGDTICNTLFSTDKTIEQYEKMKCLDEFILLLRNTLTEMGTTYSSDKSTQNAENYFAAIDALFSAADLSCNFALEYAKILYEDAALGWLTISEIDYKQYMSSVNSIKTRYNSQKKILVDNYLANLECDYPDIYIILMGLDVEPPITVTGIAFDYEETVIGLDDPLFCAVEKPVISPSNATNQKITYVSSDPAILDIPAESEWYHPKKAGTVTITAISEDGNFTDTIRVHVVEGQSGAWDAITVPKIVEYGTCGKNLNWTLYENGKLVISGEGEMDNYVLHAYYDILKRAPWFSYENQVQIKEIILENGMTSIGKNAFPNCSNLISITIPESITAIGADAFLGCSGLTSIVIPEGVTSIGDCAFSGCSSLTSIVIPEGVTSIGDCAFSGCSSLTNVTIPKSVTTIGYEAFKNCSNLASITISEGVTTIGSSAFSGCSSLTNITIPKSVITIGEDTFRDCSSLTSITIPESVTTIGRSAFKNCSSLTNITIPKSVIIIGDNTFRDCSSLANITISENVTSIGSTAFSGCSSLINITIPKSVTTIGYEAFFNCSSLTSITIPEGVTTIENYAFSGCSSLASITISAGVTTIENYAFNNCSNLTNIAIPKSVITIGDSAFSGCSSLTSIIIPEGITSIESSTFSGCRSLTNIIIPEGITSIGDSVFRSCSNLTSIAIPKSVTNIGRYAFLGCNNLTSIIIPKGVTTIGRSAFSGCSNLSSITIPGGITQIDSYAFSDCSSLNNITIPDSITKIGHSAFSDCSSLSSIIIPEGITNISSSAFSGCSSLSNVTIPNSITKIGDSAFSGCISLNNITIPETVTTIGDSAFFNCNHLTIYGKENSYAHTYALENHIHFQALSVATQVSKITLNPSKATLKLGETLQIKSSVMPENAENKQLKWTTDNPKVVTVKNGLIKAVGKGTATITATSQDGSNRTASCKITVQENTSSPKKKQVITGTNHYKKTAGCKPFYLDAKLKIGKGKLNYVSSNSSVASVSNAGKVTIKKVGNTIITITAVSTSDYLSCKFKINLKVTAPAKGSILTDTKTKAKYTVVKQGKTIEYNKPKNKNITKVSIPATITIFGTKYSVIGISTNAFYNCKKLKSITLGKNISSIGTKAFYNCNNLTKFTIPSKVAKIGKQAFYNCKKLKSITVQTTKLTEKSVGANAFKGIHANASIKVPKKKKTAYIKLFRKKGIGKKVKVK